MGRAVVGRGCVPPLQPRGTAPWGDALGEPRAHLLGWENTTVTPHPPTPQKMPPPHCHPKAGSQRGRTPW